MSEVRLIPVALIAIGLLGGGCESLRPPARDRAVWEQEQKQPEPSPQEKGREQLLYTAVETLGTALAH